MEVGSATVLNHSLTGARYSAVVVVLIQSRSLQYNRCPSETKHQSVIVVSLCTPSVQPVVVEQSKEWQLSSYSHLFCAREE